MGPRFDHEELIAAAARIGMTAEMAEIEANGIDAACSRAVRRGTVRECDLAAIDRKLASSACHLRHIDFGKDTRNDRPSH